MNRSKFFLVAALSLVVLAKSGVALGKPSQEALEHCKDLEDMAGKVMTLRQEGAAMSEVMTVAAETGGYWGRSIATLTEMAFRFPREKSLEDQDDAIAEFKNAVFAGCLQGRDGS